MRIPDCCLCGVLIGGAVLFIANCFFPLILNAISQYKMKNMLALAPDSYSFPFWKTPPVPVYFELYVFHIANPEEVLQGSAPSLVERGPYTYRVSLEKVNITFNANDTVSYRQVQTFVYDRERSIGDENDTFNTVNAPLFTVGTLLQWEYPWMQSVVNLLMEELGELPIITVSVHDIFWGYEDRFLKIVKEVLDTFHIHSKLITGAFGYYMGKNATDDGLYTVHTGVGDLSKFLIIDNWNGERSLGYYSTKWADMINGTDGSLYPPFVTTDRILRMYDSNLFRSMSMVYREPSSVLGIPTMKFVVPENEFANASVNPDNAGFCTPYGNCIPSGVLNCSAMGFGAPIFVSMPHFLGGDPYYFQKVHGLHPDKTLHQPYFNLHQLTGVCLSAARRYQLNVQIKEFPFLTKTHGLQLAYVPIMWINGRAVINDETRDLFKNQIELPLGIVTGFHYALFGLAPVMVLASGFLIYRRRKHKREGYQSLDVQTDTATETPSTETEST